MRNITETMHYASQYLAAVANTFLPIEDDDSQAQLQWLSDNQVLATKKFQHGSLQVIINPYNYAIEIVKNGKMLSSLGLANTGHQEIMGWLIDYFSMMGTKEEVKWSFQYSLPFHEKAATYAFPVLSYAQLAAFCDERSLAQKVLSTVCQHYEVKSPIGIWPHHFDTGAIISLQRLNTQYQAGIGLAIPDDMCYEPYYYLQFPCKEAGIDPSSLSPKGVGKWIDLENWQGAILPATQKEEKALIEFFRVNIALLVGQSFVLQ